MEWPAVVAGGDFRVGFLGLLERQIASQRYNAVQLEIELLEAIEIDVGQAFGGEPAVLDPLRKLGHGGEGDVFVFCGKRAGIGVAADESILGRVNLDAGQDGVPARGRRQSGFERELARPVRRS